MLKRHLAPLSLALPLACLSGCETVFPPPPEELDLWKDASAGVVDFELRDLCDEFWQAWLVADPFLATRLGDPRHHGETPELSLTARQTRVLRLKDFQRRLRIIRERGDLAGDDVLTAELLDHELTGAIDLGEMRLEDWNVDPLEGPHIQVLNLAEIQPAGTARERRQLVARWQRFGQYLRDSANNLRLGQSLGKVAPRRAVEKVIRQIDEVLAVEPLDSPLVQVALGGGHYVELLAEGSLARIAHDELGDSRDQTILRAVNPHVVEAGHREETTRVLVPAKNDPLTPEERGALFSGALKAVEEDIYPALVYYRTVLEERILPVARSEEESGLIHLRDDRADYRELIRHHTSLPLEECDARAIHDYGLAEVERIRSEIAVLGQRLFGTSDVASIQERLRSDPKMHFATREEVLAKASEALARADAAMPRWFGRLPLAHCEVVPIAPYEEKDSTIAYYRRPAPDGSRPGRYFVNTFAPETRPRYEAEVLAYHESIPGHHLQIAIAQELDDIPLFRRHTGSTAFVEGWALYTERLCDEMGLYSGDLDRLGVLSFDAWRACRLVVDTGIHALGWSRQMAIDYMYDNTLLARNNIANEVDRYIAWPGQALAYKIGQREILALRDLAREALGDRFDDRAFHDRVLENGAVTLTSLRGIVGRWLDEQ